MHKILVVDDSETQLNILQNRLVKSGFEVVTAKDGEDGYIKFFETAPDIVISDILLPKVDGYQFCKLLKLNQLSQNVPVILFTASEKKADAFWSKKAGADMFVHKAPEFESMIDAINSLITKYPVCEERKQQILSHKINNNSAYLEINSILNSFLVKSEFLNEFKCLNDLLNYEKVLIEKIFSLFDMFLDFDIAGLFFKNYDNYESPLLYISTNKNTSEVVLNRFKDEFFQKIEQKQKETLYEHLTSDESQTVIDDFDKLTTRFVLPIEVDAQLIGAIGFYSSKQINYSEIKLFNPMIKELLSVFKIKYLLAQKEFESTIDGLSGLYNRRQFEIALNHEFNRIKRTSGNLSIALLDIDRFKQINDNYGHQYGDYILKELSQLLKKTFRRTDLIYRYGGDELVIIMPDTESDYAFLPSQRFKTVLENHDFDKDGIKTKVTISIGISTCFSKHSDPSQILKYADSALYQAKKDGRNRIVVYHE